MAEATSQPQKEDILRERRNRKVHNHLEQYAPVWLVNEQVLLEADALQFEVVFLHPQYSWARRRYFYDAFNDVLYHKGQVTLDEEATYELQATPPFIDAPVLNTVNSYGG
ncbi:MAG: hypothetical protein HC915_00960 [Anaerolineae bacterium]|nr:hypothetical protein [Anaerolineae bacterium]